MALSPADFYAFSQATGFPVPEDPESRARIAPQVADWRRNQLKSPETKQSDNSGLLNALGITAAVGGGAALLAGALGRRGGVRMGNAGQAARQAAQQVEVTDFGNVYKAAGRPAPSRPAPTPTPTAAAPQRPATSRQGGIKFADLSQITGTEPAGLLRGRQAGGEITSAPGRGALTSLRITEVPVVDITEAAGQAQLPSSKDFIAGYFQKTATPAGYLTEATRQIPADSQIVAVQTEKPASLVDRQNAIQSLVPDQAFNALDAAEDQMTGRMKQQLQRNEDLDMSQIDLLEEIAEYNYIQGMEQDEPINRVASQLSDGLPVDQAEGLKVLDLRNKQSFQIPPRALGQQQNESQLLNQARQYLLAKEIDTDFDYSAENKIQAAQVQDRIQRAQYLREQADQILADIKAESRPQAQQVSPQEFAAEFNKKYKEELNDQLRDVDNARQRAELKAAQSAAIGEDIESLLLGDPSLVDTTMRGKALRGGKPNIAGDIVYQDAAGEFVSADTGLKTRLKQGPEYEIKSRLLNELNTASDEDLTELILKGQQAPMNQYLKNLVTSRYGSTQQLDLPSQVIDPEQIFGTQFDEGLARMASNVLRARASRNLEPTDLQLSALDRARASVAASQEVLNQMRNPRPTVSPGPAQDVARAMETLRRGMVVEPSEPLPVLPHINQLRTGYATDEELGPILGAADVYTGAAAEAAGPVIFTGKSKANSVIRGPRITGAINTPTGRYLTQDNPDVLGTVYEVAGTKANRAISAQVEANAQAFLADALTGGLQTKAAVSPERFVTPGRTPLKQLELPLDPGASTENAAQVSQMSPLSLQSTLGLPGQQPSQRTLYARYQPGRSGTTPLSPFIGDMPGGTVVIEPTPSDIPNARRDIGTPPGSRIDLTRRGAKARFFPDFLLGDVPQETFVTGMEPAPIGPLTQSPGLPRIGGYQQQAVLGAGRVPTTQLTSIGQRVAYPRMSPLVKAPDYSGNIATNIPLYGIDPGAEDWRNDLMRSAFRRGGPIRTYQAVPTRQDPNIYTPEQQKTLNTIENNLISNAAYSQYDLPMNFAYQGQSIPNTPPTTFEAIQAGLRTSTLRQPGQVPARVTPGSTITAVGPQGQRQLLQVTGRRMVTPDMAQELSKVERWTPEFLTNYINKRGGKMEQITYKMI